MQDYAGLCRIFHRSPLVTILNRVESDATVPVPAFLLFAEKSALNHALAKAAILDGKFAIASTPCGVRGVAENFGASADATAAT